MEMEMISRDEAERIVLNVGGIRYETYRSTLRTLPGTRLANLVDTVSKPTELYFDRNSCVFDHILNYYRTGKLHCPSDVCGALIEEELAFWGINEMDLEKCCWLSFRQRRDAEEALARFETQDLKGEDSCQNLKSKIWALFDDPYSSWAAMVIAIVSLLVILLSIIAFCLATCPSFRNSVVNEEEADPDNVTMFAEYWEMVPLQRLLIVEYVCVALFTFEFLVRILSCPDVLQFLKNPLNIIDFLAILPLYIELALSRLYPITLVDRLGFLRVVRFVRLLRILKLVPHVLGIRVLGHTLWASIYDLSFLLMFFAIGVLTFGTFIYYAERISYDRTVFSDIPLSFWWAVTTMTTVGYGDMYPETWQGQVVGAFCAVAGVYMIVFSMSIMVNNFSTCYSIAMSKQNLLKRKKGSSLSTQASPTSCGENSA